MKTYKIFYLRPTQQARLLIDIPDSIRLSIIPNQILEDYAYIRTIQAEDLEDVFRTQQGEVWSPNGEARNLIKAAGAAHTSMSMNDITYCVEDDSWHLCITHGWYKLEVYGWHKAMVSVLEKDIQACYETLDKAMNLTNPVLQFLSFVRSDEDVPDTLRDSAMKTLTKMSVIENCITDTYFSLEVGAETVRRYVHAYMIIDEKDESIEMKATTLGKNLHLSPNTINNAYVRGRRDYYDAMNADTSRPERAKFLAEQAEKRRAEEEVVNRRAQESIDAARADGNTTWGKLVE